MQIEPYYDDAGITIYVTNRVPRPGTVLRNEDGDGCSLVVTEGTDPIAALIELVDIEFGGLFAPDNPAIVRAARSLKIEEWRSCSRAWREAEAVDDFPDTYIDWWAPHGDGKRSILVLDFRGDIYGLGEEAEAAVSPAPDQPADGSIGPDTTP